MRKSQPPTIVIDTREQLPFVFTLPSKRATLATGDYSVEGFEDSLAIERKSLGDLLSCLGGERERFEAQLGRLRALRHHTLVVECGLYQLARGDYTSRIRPTAVVGSLAAFIADGTHVVFASNAETAATFTERLLLKFHKRALAAGEQAA